TRGGGAGVWGGEACRANHDPAAADCGDPLRGARVGSEFDACQLLDPGGSAAPQRYGWIPSAYSAVIAAPRSTPIAAPIAVPSATPGRFESPRVHRQLGLQGREQLLIRRITGHPQRLQAGEELREGKLRLCLPRLLQHPHDPGDPSGIFHQYLLITERSGGDVLKIWGVEQEATRHTVPGKFSLILNITDNRGENRQHNNRLPVDPPHEHGLATSLAQRRMGS